MNIKIDLSDAHVMGLMTNPGWEGSFNILKSRIEQLQTFQSGRLQNSDKLPAVCFACTPDKQVPLQGSLECLDLLLDQVLIHPELPALRRCRDKVDKLLSCFSPVDG